MAASSSMSVTHNSNNEAELEKEKSVEEISSSLPKEKSVEEIISSLPKEKSVEEIISSLPKEKSVEEIISSLPKEKGWVTHHLYQYQGFWYHHHVLPGLIFAQQNFKAHSTDILLASHPKCGTTWLKSLAFAIKNRASPPSPQMEEQPTQTPNPLLNSNAHSLIPTLELGILKGYSLEEIEALPSPRLIATHMPYSSLPESVLDSGCKVVYLCREPKDMFVSMWYFFDKAPAEVPIISMPEAFDLFCQGISFFGPYWDHVLEFYKASLKWPERLLFLKYEDMQSDTLNLVKRLAEFMGYPFSTDEESKGVVEEIIQICCFENISNLEVNKKGMSFGVINNDIFFRKGKVGDSKNYLTTEMVERIDKIFKEKFEGLELGY